MVTTLGGTRYVQATLADLQRAREWYHSLEYAAALEIRRTALDRRLYFVEGAPVDVIRQTSATSGKLRSAASRSVSSNVTSCSFPAK